MPEKKSTVGEEAYKRLLDPDTTQTVVDTQREMDKEYFEEIKKCIENHKSWHEPYYIVVIAKKESLMTNVVRRYFLARHSLPTPDFDQTVWRYCPKTGDLRFLWVLPDRNTAMWMANEPENVPDEMQALLGSVNDFLDKRLYSHYMKEFHKEECATQVDFVTDNLPISTKSV